MSYRLRMRRADGDISWFPSPPAGLSRTQERVRRLLQGLAPLELTHEIRQPRRAVYPVAIDRPGRIYSRSRVFSSRRLSSHAKPYFSRYMQSVEVLRPRQVSFCQSRAARREVLFARNVAGRRGVGRGKPWRRTFESNYSCRR